MKWLDRIAATVLIDLKDGTATLSKGDFPARILRDLSDILSHDHKINGYLWIKKGGRWIFSGTVPQPIQQRIRNVLASL